MAYWDTEEEEEEEKKNKVKVYLNAKAFEKIRAYLEIAKNDEFMVLLVRKKKKLDKMEISIDDIILPPQTVSGGKCELDADKFANIMTDIVNKNPKLLPLVCGILHSHPGMGVFFSVTDDKMHSDILKYLSDDAVWVSIVIDDKLNTLGKVLLKNKFGEFEFDNVEIKIDFDVDIKTVKRCRKEWKKLVKSEPIQTTVIYGTYPRKYHNYGSGNISNRNLINQNGKWEAFPEINKTKKRRLVGKLRHKKYVGTISDDEWNFLFDLECDLYGYSRTCQLDEEAY